jgi:hypothetical protein
MLCYKIFNYKVYTIYQYIPNTGIPVYQYTSTPVYRYNSIWYIQSTELKENGDFRLFAANGKRKQQTSVCFLQMENKNRSLFSLVGKR